MYLKLRQKIPHNLFSINDVGKLFPMESGHSIRVGLKRLATRELVLPIKRGLYAFSKDKIDEVALSSFLYQPSYVSLESALWYYGLIPDIPQSITAVTPVTTKKFLTPAGIYYYHKISRSLYFGYKQVQNSDAIFNLALPEKALLDFLYLRHVASLSSLRLQKQKLERLQLLRFVKNYPTRVKQIIYEQFGH